MCAMHVSLACFMIMSDWMSCVGYIEENFWFEVDRQHGHIILYSKFFDCPKLIN